MDIQPTSSALQETFAQLARITNPGPLEIFLGLAPERHEIGSGWYGLKYRTTYDRTVIDVTPGAPANDVRLRLERNRRGHVTMTAGTEDTLDAVTQALAKREAEQARRARLPFLRRIFT